MTRLVSIIIAVVFLSASCSPRVIENTHTQVEYRDKLVRDSLYLRDSIYIKEFVKGDTVYVNKYVDRIVYKDRFRCDTSYVAIHDTTTVERKIPAELSWIQKAKLDLFPFLFLIAAGFAGWTFRKQIFTIIKKLI